MKHQRKNLAVCLNRGDLHTSIESDERQRRQNESLTPKK